jgi:hypothetical protein
MPRVLKVYLLEKIKLYTLTTQTPLNTLPLNHLNVSKGLLVSSHIS